MRRTALDDLHGFIVDFGRSALFRDSEPHDTQRAVNAIVAVSSDRQPRNLPFARSTYSAGSPRAFTHSW
jgi:hypothetical protein